MRIEADTHCHSIASTHAYSTINELAESAKENGVRLFALTDHAPASPDAPHIWHFHNYKILPRKIRGVPMLKGAEANIVDYEGTLDLDERELSALEWVIASFHTPVVHGGTPEQTAHAYQRLARENPLVDVIGHPTTDYFPFDFEPTLKCFKEYEKLVELNESSLQYKKGSARNAREMLLLCKRFEIPIVVNTDCHYCTLIGQVPLAMQMLEELDFPERLVFNASAGRVIEQVERKHGISLQNCLD